MDCILNLILHNRVYLSRYTQNIAKQRCDILIIVFKHLFIILVVNIEFSITLGHLYIEFINKTIITKLYTI